MSSRRSYFSNDDDRVTSHASSRTQPRTFEFEQEEEEEEITTIRNPRSQTGNIDGRHRAPSKTY